MKWSSCSILQIEISKGPSTNRESIVPTYTGRCLDSKFKSFKSKCSGSDKRVKKNANSICLPNVILPKFEAGIGHYQ